MPVKSSNGKRVYLGDVVCVELYFTTDELMADDMLPEYRFDYSEARPNRFAARLSQTRTVVLEADVAAVFTSQEAVNAVLRALIQTMPKAAGRETG